MRYRILIVDDDPQNLEALWRVLVHVHEYDLARATSAEEALQLLHAEGHHIDLILTDQSLPGRSGVELLEEAKVLSPAVRIVITAHTEPSGVLEAINRGEVYRYVTKPWSTEELRLLVAQALEHHQLRRDNAELIAELKRKNVELKAMAARVADALLEGIAPSTAATRSSAEASLGRRDVLTAAAYPTVKTAAHAIVDALTQAREQLRDPSAHGPACDLVARSCLVEARRILSVVAEIDELVA